METVRQKQFHSPLQLRHTGTGRQQRRKKFHNINWSQNSLPQYLTAQRLNCLPTQNIWFRCANPTAEQTTIGDMLRLWRCNLIILSNFKTMVKGILSRVRLFATPWTEAYQAPLSMGFSRQERWSGLPFPSPGDLPDPGIECGSPALLADALPSEPPGKA